MFLYHLTDSQGGYYRTSFKDRLSNNYVCLHGSTEILDLSDHREDIKIMKAGYKEISWFLVILPFILFFIILGLILVTYSDTISMIQ